MPNLIEIGSVILEKKVKKITDRKQTKRDKKSLLELLVQVSILPFGFR